MSRTLVLRLVLLSFGLVALVGGCSSDSERARERSHEVAILNTLNFGPEWIVTTTLQSKDELGEHTERVYWSGPSAWTSLVARVRSSRTSDSLWGFRSSVKRSSDVRSLDATIDGCNVFVDRGQLPREEDLGGGSIPTDATGIGMYVKVRCRAVSNP